MKHAHASAIAIVAAASLASGNVFAATSTNTFDVTLEFENTCRASVPDIAFGLHDHLLDPISTTSVGVLFCSGAILAEITYDVGTGTGSTFAERQLSHPTAPETIGFNIYDNPAHTLILGDMTGGTLGQALAGSGTFTIYAQTSVTSDPKPVGLYSSTITVTITF